jgi:hypothetical protein
MEEVKVVKNPGSPVPVKTSSIKADMKGVKTSGVKVRGVGAAIKGTTARGPMA